MKRTLAIELFAEMLARPDDQLDLAAAALLIAVDEYPNLNIQKYLHTIEDLADSVEASIDFSIKDNPLDAIERINRILFKSLGFRGNTEAYYDPRNSFLNEVLDRRTGIPITLSVLYIEVAKRLQLPIQGVGMPGHFLVKCPYGGAQIFIDPFNQGAILIENDCKRKLQEMFGEEFQFEPDHLEAVGKRQILARMLANLKGIYFKRQNFPKAKQTVDKILVIAPDAATELRDRGFALYKMNQLSLAVEDWSRYLELQPEAPDSEAIRNNLKVLGALLAMQN